jgi:hypothetical protein
MHALILEGLLRSTLGVGCDVLLHFEQKVGAHADLTVESGTGGKEKAT